MTNLTSTESTSGDSRLINQTLRKLTARTQITRVVVIVAAVLIWLYVSSLLLRFGSGLTYANLASFGQQVVDFLIRINPYLWWVAVALWSLFVFFSVRAWLNNSIEAGRAAPVDPDEFKRLTAQVSPNALDVMRWSWANREEPFTVGDLRRALYEIRHQRVDKIAIVREQEAILESAGTAQASARTVGTQRAHVPATTPQRREPGSATLAHSSASVGAPVATPRHPADAPILGDTRPTDARRQVDVAGDARQADGTRRPVEPRFDKLD